jgi:hypothetical protein
VPTSGSRKRKRTASSTDEECAAAARVAQGRLPAQAAALEEAVLETLQHRRDCAVALDSCVYQWDGLRNRGGEDTAGAAPTAGRQARCAVSSGLPIRLQVKIDCPLWTPDQLSTVKVGYAVPRRGESKLHWAGRLGDTAYTCCMACQCTTCTTLHTDGLVTRMNPLVCRCRPRTQRTMLSGLADLRSKQERRV